MVKKKKPPPSSSSSSESSDCSSDDLSNGVRNKSVKVSVPPCSSDKIASGRDTSGQSVPDCPVNAGAIRLAMAGKKALSDVDGNGVRRKKPGLDTTAMGLPLVEGPMAARQLASGSTSGPGFRSSKLKKSGMEAGEADGAGCMKASVINEDRDEAVKIYKESVAEDGELQAGGSQLRILPRQAVIDNQVKTAHPRSRYLNLNLHANGESAVAAADASLDNMSSVGVGVGDCNADRFCPDPVQKPPVASCAQTPLPTKISSGGLTTKPKQLFDSDGKCLQSSGAVTVVEGAQVNSIEQVKPTSAQGNTGSFAETVKLNSGKFGGQKKSFMNAGLGSKLTFTKQHGDVARLDDSDVVPLEQAWGWSLLGRFVGALPSPFQIRQMIRSWGVRSNFRVEEGWFIFEFNCEEDQLRVLRGGPYFIYGKPMILKLITEDFAFRKKDLAIIPLWVRINGLPKIYWTISGLEKIVSLFGVPLYMDPVTESRKRGSYARVLVELNFAEPIPNEVRVQLRDGTERMCPLFVENCPAYCPLCLTFGHVEDFCNLSEKKLTNSLPINEAVSTRKPSRRNRSRKRNRNTHLGTEDDKNVTGNVLDDVQDERDKIEGADACRSKTISGVNSLSDAQDHIAKDKSPPLNLATPGLNQAVNLGVECLGKRVEQGNTRVAVSDSDDYDSTSDEQSVGDLPEANGCMAPQVTPHREIPNSLKASGNVPGLNFEENAFIPVKSKAKRRGAKRDLLLE